MLNGCGYIVFLLFLVPYIESGKLKLFDANYVVVYPALPFSLMTTLACDTCSLYYNTTSTMIQS